MARPATKALETYGVVHIARRGTRFRVYWVENGRQRERSATTIQAARQVAISEAARIGLPGGAVQPDVTVAALATAWLAERHPSWGVRHRGKMRTVVRTHLIPALGTRKASTLTPKAFQAVLDDLAAKGYSSSLISGALQALRGIVTYGRQVGVWGQTEDPLVGVRPTKAPQDPFELVAAEDVPTRAQVDALAAAMAKWEDGVFVRFAAGCGMRWAECIAVRVCDVELERRRVNVTRQIAEAEDGSLDVRAPKTKRGVRVAPIPRDLVDDLAKLMVGKEPTDLLFPAPRGGPKRRSNWNRRSWRPAHEAAGWPASLTFHSLRHFAASDWLRRGIELPDASRMLGHSSPRFTAARYVGADSEHVDRALSVL